MPIRSGLTDGMPPQVDLQTSHAQLVFQSCMPLRSNPRERAPQQMDLQTSRAQVVLQSSVPLTSGLTDGMP